MQEEPLRVILIDDETEACDNLTNIIAAYIQTPIEIIGVFHNTEDADEGIRRLKPDAIFIDIEMPGENAFQYLERLPVIDFEVVFVTAYDEYAVRAFKINALDYILKPISIEEVRLAVEKVNAKIAGTRKLKNLNEYNGLSKNFADKKEIDYIRLRTNNSLEIVLFSDICFAEAMGNYSSIHYMENGKEKHIIMSHSISHYEELFPAALFFRIHKSFLVNITCINKVSVDPATGGYLALMSNGKELPVSRRRYEPLLVFMKTAQSDRSDKS